MPQADSDNTELAALRAMDRANSNIDQAKSIVSCLIDGLIPGGNIVEDVPYNAESLFNTLRAIRDLIDRSDEDVRTLWKAHQGSVQ